MGDILFDWCVTKEADSNMWSAKKGTATITAGSLESLREAVRDEITRDDPNEHLLQVILAIKTLADRGCIGHTGLNAEAYDRLSLVMTNAHAYLMRCNYPND